MDVFQEMELISKRASRTQIDLDKIGESINESLKLDLAFSSRLKELLRKLTYFHIFLIDLIEEVIHLVI